MKVVISINCMVCMFNWSIIRIVNILIGNTWEKGIKRKKEFYLKHQISILKTSLVKM